MSSSYLASLYRPWGYFIPVQHLNQIFTRRSLFAFCVSLLFRVDTTRVEFTISLRENWSLPFLALQVAAITCYLRPHLSALQQVHTHPQLSYDKIKQSKVTDGQAVEEGGKPVIICSPFSLNEQKVYRAGSRKSTGKMFVSMAKRSKKIWMAIQRTQTSKKKKSSDEPSSHENRICGHQIEMWI